MIDPETKFRITWPGLGVCQDEEENEGGKGKEAKSKKGKKVKSKRGKAKKEKEEKNKGEDEEDTEDCGCSHVYPCRNWCAGVQACCVSCAEALGECPRCACLRVRGWCGRLGRGLGGCLAGCERLCGLVFSAIVTLVGCLGMVLVVYYLWPAIFNDDEENNKKMK